MEKKDSPVRTIDIAKKERQVPAAVKEELKQFNRMKRSIRQALADGPLTIPELADKLNITKAEATFYLMSLRKYGIVTAGEQDDMDEYYFYQLKK
jgi:DNA-directed RNA polymerase specialized sigma subunit